MLTWNQAPPENESVRAGSLGALPQTPEFHALESYDVICAHRARIFLVAAERCEGGVTNVPIWWVIEKILPSGIDDVARVTRTMERPPTVRVVGGRTLRKHALTKFVSRRR